MIKSYFSYCSFILLLVYSLRSDSLFGQQNQKADSLKKLLQQKLIYATALPIATDLQTQTNQENILAERLHIPGFRITISAWKMDTTCSLRVLKVKVNLQMR
jgi:hypothetical protein